MDEKKLSPLAIAHLVLMGALLLLNLSMIGLLLWDPALQGAASDRSLLLNTAFSLVLYLANCLALGCGMLYTLRGYTKNAAVYYRTFLLLTAVSSLLYAVSTACYRSSLEPFDPAGTVSAGQYVVGLLLRSFPLMMAKAALLFILVLAPDLGRRYAWIAFGLLLALDLLFSLLSMGSVDLALILLLGVFTRLAMDGTVWLAIRGKYVDKERRGTQ